MRSRYRHLSAEERVKIETLAGEGHSRKAIAKRLGRAQSTISREMSRNREGERPYGAARAQAFAAGRRQAASERPRRLQPEDWERFEALLKEGWSPEQIAGREKRLGGAAVSATWLYAWIREDRASGGKLYLYLRRQGKRRKAKKGSGEAGAGLIPGRVDISLRPKVVDEKSRIGDLEVDLIIGKGHRGAVLTVVDRKSKYAWLAALTGKTAAETTRELIRLLEPLKGRLRTITADNGKEFAGHAEVAAALGLDYYFARPYHSWERGLSEHTNGLARQYWPKWKQFNHVPPEEVQRVQGLLNNRPRKALGYRTPAEVLQAG